VLRIAAKVSDPRHPNYTKYMKAAEIAKLTAPKPADVAAVRAWLQASSVK